MKGWICGKPHPRAENEYLKLKYVCIKTFDHKKGHIYGMMCSSVKNACDIYRIYLANSSGFENSKQIEKEVKKYYFIDNYINDVVIKHHRYISMSLTNHDCKFDVDDN